jgi:hypothetical protein
MGLKLDSSVRETNTARMERDLDVGRREGAVVYYTTLSVTQTTQHPTNGGQRTAGSDNAITRWLVRIQAGTPNFMVCLSPFRHRIINRLGNYRFLPNPLSSHESTIYNSKLHSSVLTQRKRRSINIKLIKGHVQGNGWGVSCALQYCPGICLLRTEDNHWEIQTRQTVSAEVRVGYRCSIVNISANLRMEERRILRHYKHWNMYSPIHIIIVITRRRPTQLGHALCVGKERKTLNIMVG